MYVEVRLSTNRRRGVSRSDKLSENQPCGRHQTEKSVEKNLEDPQRIESSTMGTTLVGVNGEVNWTRQRSLFLSCFRSPTAVLLRVCVAVNLTNVWMYVVWARP